MDDYRRPAYPPPSVSAALSVFLLGRVSVFFADYVILPLNRNHQEVWDSRRIMASSKRAQREAAGEYDRSQVCLACRRCLSPSTCQSLAEAKAQALIRQKAQKSF